MDNFLAQTLAGISPILRKGKRRAFTGAGRCLVCLNLRLPLRLTALWCSLLASTAMKRRLWKCWTHSFRRCLKGKSPALAIAGDSGESSGVGRGGTLLP